MAPLIPSQADHAEVVKLLLEAKADIDAKADNGATALMMAASEGHIDIVKLLLEAKADVNAKRQKWRHSLARCITERPQQRRGTTQNARSQGIVSNNVPITHRRRFTMLKSGINLLRNWAADLGHHFLFVNLCGSRRGTDNCG